MTALLFVIASAEEVKYRLLTAYAFVVIPFAAVRAAGSDKLRTAGLVDVFGHLVHMQVRCDTEHRHIPIQGIYKGLHNIARPFFSHTSVSSKHLYGLKYRNTFVDLRLVMSKIQSVAHTLLIGIQKNLSFLFKIGNELIEQGSELQAVDHYVHSVCLDDIPQCFLRILERKLVLILLFKLRTAEGATYNKAGTGIGFPLTAALFTLHCNITAFLEILFPLKNHDS